MSPRGVAVFALALGACAHAPQPDELGVQRIAAEVEQLRGLRRRRALTVVVLDAAQMRATLKGTHKLKPSEVAAEGAAWIAFGFIPAGFDLGASVREVIDEQVLAFYDHRRRRLYLPRETKPEPGGEDEGRGVIAHEVEHALQDQTFDLREKRGKTADARLAWSAIVEGDAMLVMIGYLAARQHIDLALAFERLGRMLQEKGDAGMPASPGTAPRLSAAPPLLRESLAFPYVGALELLTARYRAGAFALVDQLFRAPPVSTEQVMHPDKYLAGEPPIPVKDPKLPPGYRRRWVDTLGEMRTRVLLSSCLPRRDAAESASGWGGDRFVVGEAADGRLLLLWSTVWDDELAAIRFERAMLVWQHSWQPPPAGARPAVSNDAVIVREGRRVVVVRGVPEATGTPLVPALLAL